MIPKVIHYCWFGGNPLPEAAKKCIASWKKFCPDYEIVQWDESNYDVTKNQYMYQAYQAGKWAFVSDYARLDIIYEHGGIYFDTDVEVIKNMDSFLEDPMFCGWESNVENQAGNKVAFGLGFGAEQYNLVLKKTLDVYENLTFLQEDGTYNLVPCPYYQTLALLQLGLDDSQMTLQKLKDATVYPCEYFSPKNYYTGQIHITENTHTIHHYSALWLSEKQRKAVSIRRIIRSKMGNQFAEKFCNNNMYYFFEHWYADGILDVICRVKNKLMRK